MRVDEPGGVEKPHHDRASTVYVECWPIAYGNWLKQRSQT